MSHYTHLSIEERENLLVLYTKKKSLGEIAEEMGRSKSTISRELKRNTGQKQAYSAIAAQRKYIKKRKKCRRPKLLFDSELKGKVARLLFEEQWSPEQIAARLRKENNAVHISCNTIYRAIYADMFDEDGKKSSRRHRGSAIRKLRHHGKRRHQKNSAETRGQIVISNSIHDRPEEAETRQVIGHWEADTVAGKFGAACLATIADRASRYLIAEKLPNRKAQLLAQKMIDVFSVLPPAVVKSVTPDRGSEFAYHAVVTAALAGLPFYFPDSHSPWQRGTNENTNGLLREYFPKSFDFLSVSDSDIASVVLKLNKRPRKCLNWCSPFEVFFDVVLHLT